MLRGRDRETGRDFALKVVPLSQRDDGWQMQEARALASVGHAGVARVHEVAKDPEVDAFVMVMDLIEGVPLDQAWPGFTDEEVVTVTLSLLDGLAGLHRRGLVHGDLKPANILVTDAAPRRAVLVDFGMATWLAEGAFKGGTPAFLAPELMAGGTPSPRSDLYALGVTLLQAVLGLKSPRRTMPAVGEEVPADMATLLRRMMARRPEARYRDAAACAAAARSMFGEDGSLHLPDHLPFFGRDTAQQSLFDDLVPNSKHVCAVVEGAPGSGRRRLVKEVSSRLQRMGVRSLGVASVDPVAVESAVVSRFGGARRTTAEGWTSPGEVGGTAERAAARVAQAAGADGIVLALHLDGSAPMNAFVAALAERGRRELSLGTEPSVRLLVSADGPMPDGLNPDRVVRLRPLSEPAVAGILGEVTGLEPDAASVVRVAGLLHERVGGWPATLDTLLRRLVEDKALSRSGEDLLLDLDGLTAATREPADRLVGLGREDRMVLAAMACRRRPCVMTLLSEVTRLSADALFDSLGRLEGRGLIHRSARADDWAVSGSDVRDSARDEGDEVTRRWHRRWAEVTGGAESVLHALLAGTEVSRQDVLTSMEELVSSGDLGDAADMAGAALRRWPTEALLPVARVRLAMGEFDSGVSLLQVAVDSGGERGGEAAANLALVLVRMGRPDEALAAAEAAMDSERGRPRALASRAVIRLQMGDLTGARADAEEAAAHSEIRGLALNARGLVLLRQGDLVQAQADLREASSVFAERGDGLSATTAGLNMGIVMLRRGELTEARAVLSSAADGLDQAGATGQRATALVNLGVCQNALGDSLKASGLHREAHRLASIAGDRTTAATAAFNEGIARLDGGRAAEGYRLLRAAMAAHGAGVALRVQVIAGAHAARAAARIGRGRTARRLAARALLLGRRLGPQAWAEAALAAAEATSGARRRRWLDRAEASARRAEDRVLEGEARALGGTPTEDLIENSVVRRLSAWGASPDDRSTVARALLAARREGGDHLVRARLLSARVALEGARPEAAFRRARGALDLMSELEETMTPRAATFYRYGVLAEELRELSSKALSRLSSLADPEGGGGRRLAELVSLITETSESRSMRQLVGGVLDSAINLSGAASGVVALVKADGGLSFAMGRTEEGKPIKFPKNRMSTSVVQEVIATGRTLIIADAQGDERYSGLMSVARDQLRALAVVPLRVGASPVGALYLDGGEGPAVFRQEDIPLLEAFASLAAIAIRTRFEASRTETQTVQLGRELQTERAAGRARLTELRRGKSQGALIGNSAAMQRLRELVARCAQVDYSVLVVGESGTGKEVVIHAIAEASGCTGAVVPIHCGAMPPSLFESECFGYRKGAFTGAVADHPGLIRLAENGVLFLDEIQDLPLPSQVKLLRVLETGRVRPVGGDQEIPVQFRVMVATGGDLKEMVAQGTFREDLYFRLKVLEIAVPPLRERAEDIPLFVSHFLREAGSALRMSRTALQRLARWSWPGNVRELRNEVVRSSVMASGEEIGVENLTIGLEPERPENRGLVNAEGGPLTLREVEEHALAFALDYSGGDRKEAARLLGISRSSLYDRLKRLSQ